MAGWVLPSRKEDQYDGDTEGAVSAKHRNAPCLLLSSSPGVGAQTGIKAERWSEREPPFFAGPRSGLLLPKLVEDSWEHVSQLIHGGVHVSGDTARGSQWDMSTQGPYMLTPCPVPFTF